MNKVPHDLIINVNSPLELDQKVRRMLRSLNIIPTEQKVNKLTDALCVAFESLHGVSNLTAWRITQEWNDKHALKMVWLALQDGPSSMTRTRLRWWRAPQAPRSRIQFPNPNPKVETGTETQTGTQK